VALVLRGFLSALAGGCRAEGSRAPGSAAWLGAAAAGAFPAACGAGCCLNTLPSPPPRNELNCDHPSLTALAAFPTAALTHGQPPHTQERQQAKPRGGQGPRHPPQVWGAGIGWAPRGEALTDVLILRRVSFTPPWQRPPGTLGRGLRVLVVRQPFPRGAHAFGPRHPAGWRRRVRVDSPAERADALRACTSLDRRRVNSDRCDACSDSCSDPWGHEEHRSHIRARLAGPSS
jgi:hypothetical protein